MVNVKELNINSTTYDIVGKAVVDQNNPSTPLKQWSGTKAQYDAIVSKDADTIYNITDDSNPTNCANTSLSNLDLLGQSIIDGKVNTNSSWGFPSGTYDDLTLGASGTTYTAPANGWFNVAKTATAANQWLDVENQTSKLYVSGSVGASNYKVRLSMPAKKGDVIVVSYSAAGTSDFFRFIYAEDTN